MAMTSVVGISGCSLPGKEKPSEVRIAEKLLHEKYDEEFVIYKMGGRYGTLTNNTFSVISSPKNNPDLKFDAKIAKDGTYMTDGYVSRRVCDLIEKSLTLSLNTNLKNSVIHVGDASNANASNNSHMSIEEYIKTTKDPRFVVYIVTEKDSVTKVSSAELYNSLNIMFKSLPKLSGSLRIYIATKDAVEKTSAYLEETGRVDHGFEDLLKEAKTIYSQYQDDILVMSKEEFEVKLRGIGMGG